jgi:hypothetical protein
MFLVEYRTKSSFGRTYPARFMNVGPGNASSDEQARAYAAKRLGPNVEILDVKFSGVL